MSGQISGQTSVEVAVNSNGITAPPRIAAQVGTQIVFNIHNKTGFEQRVRIPPMEFVSSPAFQGTAFPYPLESGGYATTIPPNGNATIAVKLKSPAYFQAHWPTGKAMTYKFTIYSNDDFLDPDLEINP